MEVVFDNKTNVLNAKLHTTHDDSVIYSITTDETIFSRTYTYVKDTNPGPGGGMTTVGVINWSKKTFEVNGQRKAIDDIRRKPGGFRNKWVFARRSCCGMEELMETWRTRRSRYWKWTGDREEYDVVHQEEGWEVG